ncbi:hypothetical protein V1515DRAFT_217923 [Lipomyces mesembrius]
MDSTKVFVDNVDTFLSRIPAIIAQQVSPAAPDVSHRVPTTNSLVFHVHRGVWDVVSDMGEYNPAVLLTKLTISSICVRTVFPGMSLRNKGMLLDKSLYADPSSILLLSISSSCSVFDPFNDPESYTYHVRTVCQLHI